METFRWVYGERGKDAVVCAQVLPIQLFNRVLKNQFNRIGSIPTGSKEDPVRSRVRVVLVDADHGVGIRHVGVASAWSVAGKT